MPMPMPVLPAVPSTMTPPGCSIPRAIASRTIARAARSLTEPPGFMNSALPRIVQPVAADAARNLMSGVFPMDSMTVGLKDMLTSLRRAGTLGEAAGANKPARGRRIGEASHRPRCGRFSRFMLPAARDSRRKGKRNWDRRSFANGTRRPCLPPKTKPASMSVASAVVARGVCLRPIGCATRRCVCIVLRSLLSPIVSTRWARFIRRYHRAFEAGPQPARVLLKPVRSYVHLRLGPAGRLDVLRGHYQPVSPALFERVRAARLRRRADLHRRARGAKGERLPPGDRRLHPRFDAARGGIGDLSRQTRRRGAG